MRRLVKTKKPYERLKIDVKRSKREKWITVES